MSATHLKHLSISTLAIWIAAPALAGPVYENQSGGTFEYYGQFNPAIIAFDDGVDSNTELADSARSNSRVGFWLRQPLGESQLRFRFETALGLRQSSGISQNALPDVFDWDRTNLRHVDFSIVTPNAGTFYLGQGSMAADGIGEIDLSGTGLASAVSVGDLAGGYFLRRADGSLSSVALGDAFASFDGARRGRVRYDSPDFNGFQIAASYGQNILSSSDDDDYWDVVATYGAELNGGAEIEVGLGYQVRSRESGQDREDTIASFGVKMPSGFSVSASVGDRNTGGSFYYVKAGYEADFFRIGSTAFSVDYYSGEDLVSASDDSSSYSIGVVQDFDKANIEGYIAYQNYAYEDSISDFRDASSVVIGARYRF